MKWRRPEFIVQFKNRVGFTVVVVCLLGCLLLFSCDDTILSVRLHPHPRARKIVNYDPWLPPLLTSLSPCHPPSHKGLQSLEFRRCPWRVYAHIRGLPPLVLVLPRTYIYIRAFFTHRVCTRGPYIYIQLLVLSGINKKLTNIGKTS